MNSIINIKREFQLSSAFSQGFIVNHEVLEIQRNVVFVERSINFKLFLQIRPIVDGASIEEYVIGLFEAKVGIALKVSLSSGNKGEI